MRIDRLALLVGVGSALVLGVLGVAGAIVGFVATLAYGGPQGLSIAAAFAVGILTPLVEAVIVGAGVFASLQWLRPIAPRSPLSRLAAPVIIAAVIGAVLFAVLSTIVDVLGSLSAQSGFFGYAFPQIDSDLSAGPAIVTAMASAVQNALEVLPVVALVALVAVWYPVLREHPAQDAPASERLP